jgi:hypothetical protein
MAVARARGDVRTYFEVLARVPLYLPAVPAAGDRQRFLTWHLDGGTYLLAFTSVPALEAVLGDAAATGPVVASYPALLAGWPDPAWRLAVNPDLPIDMLVPVDRVAALLAAEPPAATLAALLAGAPVDAEPVALLKVVPPELAGGYLSGPVRQISGLVHPADAVDDVTSPAQLYDALGLAAGASPFHRSDPSALAVRWYGHGPRLYRVAYGACDARALELVGGWLVEPEPFVGAGVAAGSVPAPEFRVDALTLPHGAQLRRLDAAGWHPVASYDADLLRWVPEGPVAAAVTAR